MAMFGNKKSIFGQAKTDAPEPITIYVCDVDRVLLGSLRTSLIKEGFGQIITFNEISKVKYEISQRCPDLIVLDNEMDDPSQVKNFISELRLGKLGRNPFVPIMSMIWRPTKNSVANMVDCGVDDILTKPISINHMLEHIKGIVSLRKPFIVSSQYIGPDRRRDLEQRLATLFVVRVILYF